MSGPRMLLDTTDSGSALIIAQSDIFVHEHVLCGQRLIEVLGHYGRPMICILMLNEGVCPTHGPRRIPDDAARPEQPAAG